MALLVGKSSDSTISSNQGNNRLGGTVFSDDFPARSGKQAVSFRKDEHLNKAVVVMGGKVNRCAFLPTVQVWNMDCNEPASRKCVVYQGKQHIYKQNLRSEEVHITEQLQDVEEEKDDSNGEENKDSLSDDEDEKEALGYEKEAEEDEEDSSAAGVDEEKSDTRDQGSLMEAQEDEGPSEMEDDTPQQPHPAGAEAVEDSLRQHRSQHAERGPSA
ncbi:hypothetical protein E5288_WYG004079 [Bos mutus]|uniref:Uncharacterized protein n=1 Tax=Bos mutus TaxID=72004 RepID=A0A6B0R4R8_9CETA|nr:hypothetical protein [Bos mutus]